MKKQLVSILLTLCMVLPLMPTAAWAAEKPADAPVLVEQGDSSAAAAEKPAAAPAEKETETPAPEPLPTEIALCSYKSTNGTEGDKVSLAAAVTALNENGGGTITVTSSGLAAGLGITEDITIVAEGSNSVTVTTTEPLFSVADSKTLILGKKGMSSGLLIFNGAQQASYFASGKGKIEINDGIAIKHFARSVIGITGHRDLNVTMHGGEILENTPTASWSDGLYDYASTIINCKDFYMDGGAIHDNIANSDIICAGAGETPVQICGDAKIYNNRHDSRGTKSTVLINAFANVILSGSAEIYGCKDITNLILCFNNNVMMEGEASIHDCTSKGFQNFSSVHGIDVTMTGNASIYNCTSEIRGAVSGSRSVTMSGSASIRNCKTLSTDKDFPADGVAVFTGISPTVKSDTSFTMQDDAVISNCSGPAAAGGVLVEYGQAIMSGRAKIERCSTPELSKYEHKYTDNVNAAGGIHIIAGGLTMKDQANIDQCSTYGTAGGVYMSYSCGKYSIGTIALKDQASITNCTNLNTESLNSNYYTVGGLYSDMTDISVDPEAKITGCKGIVGGISCSAPWNEEKTVPISISGEVSKNQGIVGGGICAPQGVVLTLEETALLKNNTATVAGGGIALFSHLSTKDPDLTAMAPASLIIHGGKIIENTAPLGGGIFVAGKADIPKVTNPDAIPAVAEADISNVTITGGTIANNTSNNPEGGTATEFHGGGLFLGWNTKTNISGAVKIFDNVDADNLPNNMYLRKAPDFDVETPTSIPPENMERDQLREYLTNALNEKAVESVTKNILGHDVSVDSMREELKLYELISADDANSLNDNEIKERYIKFYSNMYALPTVESLSDAIAKYKNKSVFKPTYEEFNAICAKMITDDILDTWGRMLYASSSEDSGKLNQYAKQFGLIEDGGTYRGTITKFANAFVRYSKTDLSVFRNFCKEAEMEPALNMEEETYQTLWSVPPVFAVLSEPDARVSVSGPLTGSQIGVITEGAQYGRVVAEGINNYALTDEDLAIFSSDDPFYDVVRHPYKRNQFILKPRETANNGNGGNGSHSTRKYTLTYESNGGTAYKDERYSSGTKVTLDKVPIRESYTFTGWYADQELTDKITSVTMNSDKTVYAGWVATGVPDMLNGDDHDAYVIGYPDGNVRPQGNISRAETATIFFRLLKADTRDGNLTAENAFADVVDGQWFNKAVSTMAKLGIVKGRSAESFAPDAPITRAEFAAICARFNTKPTNTSNSFSDISGHWAEAEIERAVAFGWIAGYPDGTFRPDTYITRAEAMTMINRVLCRMPQDEKDLLRTMVVWPDNKPTDWHYLAVQEATNSHEFERKGAVNETWTKLTSAPDWTRYQ